MAAQGCFRAHQRVVADIEPQHLFLEHELGVLVELVVRHGHPCIVEDLPGIPRAAKEAEHALICLPAPGQGPVQHLFEDEAQTLARVAQ